jgi:DNA replication licensing factor MCM4
MMSNFYKKRGHLDVNRMFKAPTFNPNAKPLQLGAKDAMSSTILQNQMQGAAEQSSYTQVIWGTNINTSDVATRLKNFINTFVELKDDDDDEQYTSAPVYIEKLKEMRELEEYTLDVNCDHVFQVDQSLYRQIVEYPTDLIPIFDLVVSQIAKELFMYNIDAAGTATFNRHPTEHSALAGEEVANDMIVQIRPFNLRKVYRIRELGPEHIDKLVTLRGIVIRNSDVVPEMKEAYFACANCHREESRMAERGRITEPIECPQCNTKHQFQLIHNRSMFSDKQHVKVQETPESVPEGETPQTL